ncbi:hypothetical protein [Acinetobacter lanii]|uniref:Uncharacterized protein n=1 Tax=Acinetobacter lanii TaxID=2715163 RepID=A0A6G8S7I5_9GAMM|nr:hypothetical protein [Acinetobacter lanii]QIO10149.1 hypothetical protein G8D99_14810 [Acinetobacter lanii]
MKKIITFKDSTTRSFETNLEGFIQAVSFKESSSDLSLSLSHPLNARSAKTVNGPGYLGLFQWGEAALYELGYYLGDKGISYNDIKSAKRGSALHNSWKSQFDSNNWSGKWSGKRNINSKSDFLNNPHSQYEIIKEWINYLCKQIRNNNLNEHFGRTIQGVEINESGAIAGMHLVGIGGLGAFLGVSNFSGQKQTDGNGTHIKKYIQDFGGFDLEQCCDRKIYINLKGKNEEALVNKEVIIVSKYSGKTFSGETKVKIKSDENGYLPVIVRHPSTEIKIVADGKESNPIIQRADQKQRAILKDFEVSKFPATLEQNSTPQPKPQPDKTPQERRNEQNQPQAKQDGAAENTKDISFNIQIVEGDTGKPISNMNFFLTYKGNIKKHTANGQGIKVGINAEVGQDIEVSVSGEVGNQRIHNFKVEKALSNQTVKIKLPVQSFKIIVKKDNKLVPNLPITLFYRAREIPKKTNALGEINLKMLVGFVYGVGIGSKSLTKARVINNSPYRIFRVNEGFVKQSKALENKQQAVSPTSSTNSGSSTPAKASEVKQEPPKAIQQDTHTENGGKPLTTISNQSPATSDTTRYHIYHDGKIKRENKTATGFAEFIYYEANGTAHNLGKSKFIKAPLRKSGNEIISGNCYLIDFTKHGLYKKGNLGYKWIITGGNIRFYLNGISIAAILGTFMNLGYEEYPSSGASLKDGSSQRPSKTHRNGEACDFRYLGKDNAHRTNAIWTQNDNYDIQRNIKLVQELKKFGFTAFYTQDGYTKKPKISGTSYAPNHYHHLHIGNCVPNIQDI